MCYQVNNEFYLLSKNKELISHNLFNNKISTILLLVQFDSMLFHSHAFPQSQLTNTHKSHIVEDDAESECSSISIRICSSTPNPTMHFAKSNNAFLIHSKIQQQPNCTLPTLQLTPNIF